MKRLNSSDSSLDPICPSGWVDEEEDVLEVGGPMQAGEKKRRLRVDQVRALEKNFEVDNKLEPDRKSQLAQELGLQPRQVAVWFQNRRARWKTKQLERDYGALKSRYDALRLDYDALLRDKDSLLAELKHLKSKLNQGDERFASIVKEEEEEEEEEDNKTHEMVIDDEPVPLIYNKEGSSDSDSSAVLDATRVSFSSPLLYQHQLLKVEDEELMNGDEPCSNFFQDEVPPTLSWCCGEGWE